MTSIKQTQIEKNQLLSKVNGVDYDFSPTSTDEANKLSADISSSNNIRVNSGEPADRSRSVESSSSMTASQQDSSLLKKPPLGHGVLYNGDEKYMRKSEFNNSGTATSLFSSGNAATILSTSILWNLGYGSELPKISIEDFLGRSTPPASGTEDRVPPGTVDKVANQLSVFNSYNCIISLGVLSPASINDPKNTYHKRGADFTILRSGGGGINGKRITNAADMNKDGNLEFFIDDFEMKSIMSPNNKTGMSVGTTLSFKVSEPYSLGIFLQNLKIAASEAGYKNYTDSPFLLEIDFVGHTDNNVSVPVNYASRKIPFRLSNVQFDVERGGSTYEVSGVSWSQQSLSDEVQHIKDPVSIKGSSIADVLSFGEQSLTAVMNSKLREIAEADGLPATDLYVIRFPKFRTTLGTTTGTQPGSDSATTGPDLAEDRVIRTSDFVNRVGTFFGSSAVSSNNNVFQKLTGSSTTDVNNIGRARMIEDFNQSTNHPFMQSQAFYDKEGDVYRRNGIELTSKDGERVYNFPQGMSIQKIIEEVVLISNYASNTINTINEEGMINWFIVEPECHVLDIPEYEAITNNKPKVYVYNVVPYRVHASNMVSPNKGVPGAQSLAKQVSKVYDYIYSGKNDDVLSFDIQFNAAFFEALRADYGNFSGDTLSGAKNKLAESTPPPYLARSSQPPDTELDTYSRNRLVNNVGNSTGGAADTDPKRNLAKQFHNIILNSDADLITAEVEIWGDPYFLPNSGLGNYSSSNSGQTATINSDGSIDYQRNEVDILINFRTPVDYNKQGGMDFHSESVLVDGFSGFYKVTVVDNNINGNKFTQRLQLVRRKNQTEDGVSKFRAIAESQSPSPNQNASSPSENPGAGLT